MFVGRKNELSLLEGLLKKKSSSFVVISGRRRIGKSTLVEHFARNKKFYKFSGIPPAEGVTKESQQKSFANQLKLYFNIPISWDNWWEMLDFLANQISTEPTVILLDEISWMAQGNPEFLSILKTLWDQRFKQHSKLIFCVCGSVSSWINHHIIQSTGFVGRLSLNLTLKELSLPTCNQFWSAKAHLSAYEKFKFLSITGGIPRYLEEWQSHLTAEGNINQLCFNPNGVLFKEFEQIFNDSLAADLPTYKKIVEYLSHGSCSRDIIAKQLDTISGGYLTELLDNLISAGFITRDYTWKIQDKVYGKLSKYRLSDNYIRFYLKYIQPNKEKIEKGLFQNTSISNLPAWSSIMGLQFENLVISNAKHLFTLLNIQTSDVELCNPYFQKKTSKQSGCQIDFLIQTRSRNLYICEIKFSRNPVAKNVIEELETKCNNISAPKGYSKLPVLVHVNGVTDDLLDSDYFYRIIDFSSILLGE